MGKFEQEKTQFLGMPISTARSRLVKSIMFSLLQRLGEDTCFKCGGKIVDINTLSIEHKLPWLRVSPELFWDLQNIAFSHVLCNRPDRPYRPYDSVEERNKAQYQRRVSDPIRLKKKLESNRKWYVKVTKNPEKQKAYRIRKKLDQRRYDAARVKG